jgi:hypothetical protein
VVCLRPEFFVQRYAVDTSKLVNSAGFPGSVAFEPQAFGLELLLGGDRDRTGDLPVANDAESELRHGASIT